MSAVSECMVASMHVCVCACTTLVATCGSMLCCMPLCHECMCVIECMVASMHVCVCARGYLREHAVLHASEP